MAATSALVDNFNDNSTSASWTKTGTPASVNEQNQRMEIDHAATSGYNNLDSAVTYDLTNSSVIVQVTNVGNQSITSHEVVLGLRIDGNNVIWMVAGGNNLSAYRKVAGTQTQVGSSIAYNSTTHAWWRIRHSGSNILWDTAPDGLTWTNRWTLATPITITALIMYLSSGCWQNEASGSFGYFDNFNSPPSATSPGRFLMLGVS